MKTFRRGRTAGAVLFLSTCVFSLAVPGALRAGEQARAFEKAALQAKKQGKYLEAEQAARKALAVLLQQEWTPTPEARAHGAYLLALLDQLDEKTGDTPAALAFLSRLKAGAKVLSGEPAFTASLDLERQKLLVKTFHFQEARSLNSTLGFLCDWQVVGPFDNERGSGFGRVFPPEKKIDLSKSYQGKKRKITWRRVVVSAVPGGIVDMAAFMRPTKQVLAYAATCLVSPRETDAVLRAGSGGALSVWVNGTQVIHREVRRPFHQDQEEAAVHLLEGPNLVLVKLGAQKDSFKFSLRVCSPQGGRIPGIEARAEPDLVQREPATTTVQPGPWARGPLALLEDLYRKDKDPRWAFERAFLLTEYQTFDEDVREDRDWARKAADGAPKNPFYQYLYSVTLGRRGGIAAEKDENPRRRRLEKTLQLDSSFAEAQYALAKYYYDEQDNPTRGMEHTRKALEINPLFIEAAILRAEILDDLDGTVEKRNILESLYATPEGKLHPRLCRKVAELALDRGNLERALAIRLDLLHRVASPGALAAAVPLLVRAGKADRALALLRKGARAWPFSKKVRTVQADLLLSLGKIQQAESALQAVLDFCPGEDSILVRMGRLEGLRGNKAGMIAWFKRALAYNPNLSKVKRHLDFLQAEEKPFYADLEVKTRDILKSPPPPPPDAEAKNDPYDYLLRHKVIKVNNDGTSHIYEHLVARIFNEAGAEHFDTFSRSYFGGEQSGRILTADVIHPDGTVDRARIFSFLAGMGRIYVDLPPIKPKDVVDIAFRIDELKPSFFGTYFGHKHVFSAAEAAVVHDSRLDVISRKERYLNLYEKNGAPKPVVKNLGKDLVLRSWRMKELPRVIQENNMPSISEFCPLVEISTYRSWDEFATWWWSLVKRQYDSSPEMEAKVKELTRDCGTTTEKIRAIYDFVVTDVRYVAWEFGVHGYKPYNASTIFSRRHGDCKDKAILIGAMLKLAGIKAWPVLIYADPRRSRDDLTLPLVNLFNHCIAYVPKAGDWQGGFLDGTATYHPLGVLPTMDHGAQVLVVEGKKARIARIPWSDPARNLDDQEYVVRLSPSGDAKVHFTGKPQEDQAVYIRMDYGNEPGKRKEKLENHFSRILGKVKVDKMKFSPLLDLEKPVVYQVDMTVKEFAEKRGDALVLKPNFEPARWTRLTAAKKRIHDMILTNPWTDRFLVRYVLPPGWEPLSLPPDSSSENEYAAFSVKWRRDGKDLVVETVRTLKKERIPAAAYGLFRDFAGRLDNAETQEVLVRPAGHQGGVKRKPPSSPCSPSWARSPFPPSPGGPSAPTPRPKRPPVPSSRPGSGRPWTRPPPRRPWPTGSGKILPLPWPRGPPATSSAAGASPPIPAWEPGRSLPS